MAGFLRNRLSGGVFGQDLVQNGATRVDTTRYGAVLAASLCSWNTTTSLVESNWTGLCPDFSKVDAQLIRLVAPARGGIAIDGAGGLNFCRSRRLWLLTRL